MSSQSLAETVFSAETEERILRIASLESFSTLCFNNFHTQIDDLETIDSTFRVPIFPKVVTERLDYNAEVETFANVVYMPHYEDEGIYHYLIDEDNFGNDIVQDVVDHKSKTIFEFVSLQKRRFSDSNLFVPRVLGFSGVDDAFSLFLENRVKNILACSPIYERDVIASYNNEFPEWTRCAFRVHLMPKLRNSNRVQDLIRLGSAQAKLNQSYLLRAGQDVYYTLEKCIEEIGIDYAIQDRMLLAFICSTFDTDRPNNQGFLVGVEQNPGPGFKSLVQFLRNMESFNTECASRPKRSSVDSNRVSRLVEKKRTIKKKNEKKGRQYFPEALISAGLDEETKLFISSALSSFREILKNGVDVNIDVTKPLIQQFTTFVSYCKEHLVFLYDYAKFIFGVVYRVVNDQAKEILNFVSNLFFSFSPEGVIDGAFLLILYKETIGKYVGDMDIIGISKLIGKMKTDGKDIKSGFSWCLEIIKEVTISINTWLGTSLPVFSGDTKLDNFFQAFYTLKKRFDEKGVSQYHIAQDLYILNDTVERYYRSSNDKDEKDKIVYLLRLMKPFVSYCEASINPNNGPRIEPLAICITGPSGVGKSSFTTPILLALLARVLPKDRQSEFMSNHNEFIFFRANENEYWDGYRSSHEAIVFDDFGQKKDVPGGDNADAFELIRLKNTAPYHLHFASIADKQKNYANPRVLYATTNRNTLRFNSIMCNEAVVRRFDIAVVQVPKPEFCKDGTIDLSPWNRRLDLDKVRAKYPFDDNDVSSYLAMDVVEFIEWDFNTGHPLEGGATYDFPHFLNLCIQRYKELNTKGDAMLKYHEYVKKQFKPEGFGEEDEFHECLDLSESIKRVFDGLVTPDSIFGDKLPILKSLFAFFTPICIFAAGANYLRKFFQDEAMMSGDSSSKQKGQLKPKSMQKDGRRVYRRSIRSALAGSKFAKSARFESEGLNMNSFDFVTTIIRRNMYRLDINGRAVGNLLFVKGRTCVFPHHYNELIDQAVECDRNGQRIATLYDFNGVAHFSFDWDQDMLAYQFPFDLDALVVPGIREHSDISGRFLSENAIMDRQTYECFFPVLRSSQILILEPVVRIGESVHYSGCRSNRLNYSCPSEVGDCGSTLISLDKRFSGPTILGVHTAGSTFVVGQKLCAGVFISKEQLSYCFEALEEDSDYVEEIDCGIGFNLEGFGGLRKAQAPKLPRKTKIVPSLLHSKIVPVTTKPANLVPFTIDGERIDPSKKAQFKYCTEPVAVPMDLVNTAAKIVNKIVLRNFAPAPWEPRLLTFEEAISGVPGVDFLNAIDRGTSAGYPHNLTMKGGKKEWLGADGDVDFSSEAIAPLRKIVESVVEKAKRGIRVEHIYMDCLKDERRPIAKVDAGKTRQFMACPVQLLVAIRIYFGDFIRHLCANHICNGISVGINPSSEEWTTLHNYLHPSPDYVHGAGDYESFDCKMPIQVEWKFLEAAEMFYSCSSTPEDVKVRKILFHDVINSLHVDRFGNIYEFDGKNPSGQPATAVMNSYVNSVMLVAGWIKNGIDPKDVEEKFRWNTFGDDHVTGFPAEFQERAGTIALAKSLKDLFGYVYTDESKTGELVNTKHMKDIAYLKRSFRFNGRTFDAPLNLDVLLETLNWEKSNSDPETMLQRFDCWYVEVARHGKKVFQEITPKVTNLIRTHYNYTSVYCVYDAAAASDVLFGDWF